MLPAAKVCFIISSDASIPKAIASNKAHILLGQECDLLIFDAHSGLEVNALAAVSGTLCGGGILGLLTPPLEQWSHYPDPAYKRFLPYPYTASAVKGLFLQRFIAANTSWVHFDVMAWNLGNKPGKPEGGEAMALKAVAEYLLRTYG